MFTKGQIYILSAIKFIYTLIILFLLLGPLIETVNERAEKPILIVGVDNSESVAIDTTNKGFIRSFVDQLSNELGQQFQLELLHFGNEVVKDGKFTFSDKVSDYTRFFDETEKQYYNLNVAAMVVIGDGIYNEGKNPEQIVSSLKRPVFTVGVGDTLSDSDQAIIDVTNNPNVFLGNSFPIEIETSFSNYQYSNTQLSVSLDGKIVHSEELEIPQSNYYLKRTISIKADEAGLKTITVSLSPFLNEKNIRNNQARFSVEVHSNKNNILFLTQGPHPDLGAFAETLMKQANYNVKFSDVTLFSGKFEDYDLVLLNQLPSTKNQSTELFKKIVGSKTAMLLVVGPNTSISAVNNLNIGFFMEPTLLTEEVTPFFNTSFSLFQLPANIKEMENIYPPLLTYYSPVKINNDYSILAYQKIKGIEMNQPLMAVGEIENTKIGIINGEGIWRWRIQEYQNMNSQTNFNQLIQSLFDYLCLREEREQFKIDYRRIVNESVPVEVKAQVFNQLYEPLNNVEVSFVLTDSTGNEMNYMFTPNEIQYHLNLGSLAPGTYKFVASTKIGEQQFSKNGEFIVQELNIEQENLQAKFQTLGFISKATKGEMYNKETANQLIEKLKSSQYNKVEVSKEKNITELIDFKWIIFFLLLVISVEWFLRKYWGSY